MTRRVFLGLTFATSAILITSSFQFLNLKKRFHIFIKNVLPWLNFDIETINKFTSDYYKYECSTLKCQIRFFLFLILENTPIFHNILQARRKIRRDDIVSKFLLSTDFFQENMNENRTIKYVLYYDPYINPCYNPKP